MLKKSYSKLFINLCAGSCTLLLVACGGGGGGGGGTQGTAPSTPLAIDTSNSTVIAAVVINTAFTSSDVSAVLGAKTDSGSGLDLNEVNKKISQIISANTLSGELVSGIVGACSLGGSITTPDTAFGTYVFNNCAEPDITLNGSMSVTGSGDFVDSFNGTFSFNNVSITTSEGTDVINGAVNISWVDDGVVETGNVNSSQLSLISGADFYDLVNLNDDYTLNINTQVDVRNVNYTLNSSVLNGQVVLTTAIDIQSYTYNEYPYAGQIICTGASNSKVRATVNPGGTGISTDTLTIETDANGDNVYESSEVLMWSQL